MPMPRLAAAGLLFLAACAHQPTPRSGSVVDRLPVEAARPAPAAPGQLSLDDIARLSGEGLGAEAIIARLRDTATRHRLAAADVLSLKSRGVPLAVIDHLLAGGRQAVHDECSEQINRREAESRRALETAEEQCRQRCTLACPPWPPYPAHPWRRWP